jgi:uncharacterized hydrophobic protein (TIGR00271 family)
MIRIHFTRTLLHEAYDNLTERAKLDLDFLLLTVAAAVICALGFKMKSTSVIVGAMVISPLLYPVICVGATTYQQDWALLARATSTFAIGASAAVAAAAAVNIFHPASFQSEIADRLAAAPANYLLVAFFSGIAGTYAFFSPKIHEAIAGIAISVALIPPVVMLGIALAERSADLFLASGKIVLCNIFGIYFGSFVTVAGLHWISGR